jgi:hypothetical protein
MHLNSTRSAFRKAGLYLFALLACLGSTALQQAHAQCTGPSGTFSVGPTGAYATLTAAIAAASTSSGISANIVFELQSTYTSAGETFPITFPANTCLNASRKITIRPAAGASGLSITSANATATIDFNGADYVTIDGRPGVSTTGLLTISNTATGGAAAVRFINDATNNVVRYCNISGSSTTNGVVYFSTGTTSGNDSNRIEYCTIGPAGSNLPLNGIYSLGSSATADNSNNGIDQCQISDYFNAALAASGIHLNSFNSGWTISNCRLFQTATRVYTTANVQTAINITSGSGYVINSNTIGYANAGGSGTTNIIGNSTALTGFPGAYVTGGSANATRYIGIQCAFTAGGDASTIYGNQISGIAMYTSATTATSATASGIFCGIAVISGAADIGITAPSQVGNVVGATSGTGSIYVAATANAGAVVGIYASSANAVNINYNSIGAIDAMGATATVCPTIHGIYTAGPSSSYDVSGNTIGNTTNPNLRMGTLTDASGNLSNAGTVFGVTSASILCNGIWSAQTGAGIIGTPARPNIIRNISQNASGTTASIRGITASGAPNISSNQINNLTSQTTATGLASTLLAGMGVFLNSISTVGAVVTKNTIHTLSLANTTTGGTNLAGVAVYAGASEVSYNRIYNLANASTSTSTTLPGTASGVFLRQPAGIQRIFNNMISLGSGLSDNTSFMGIWMQNSAVAYTMNCYHNSINIEGTANSGAAQPTFAFHRGSFSATTVVIPVDIRNNVFVNTRTGSSSTHYAIANGYGGTAVTTGWGANASDFNVLNAPSSSAIGYWTGDQSFSGWQSASAGDANSVSGVGVTFVSPATGDLHVSFGTTATRLESGGLPVGGITLDYDNQTRPGPTAVNGGGCAPDIGADEFDGVPLDVTGPVISYIPLGITSCLSPATRVFTGVTMIDCSGINVATGTRPRVYYKKSTDANTYAGNTSTDNGWKYVEASNTASPFSFTINYSLLQSAVSVGDVIQYFVVAQDAASTAHIGLNSGVFAAAPSSVALTSGAFPLTGTINSYTITSAGPGGAVTIGATGTYTSLTGASGLFNDINNLGLSSDLTATIIDASVTETGSVALNNIASSGCASTPASLLIRPQASLAATLTGSLASGLIKLNGADRVTIDGINAGGSSLLITNTNTAGTVLWITSSGVADGATNDTIRNCTIAGVSGATTLAGIVTGSGTTLGAAADAPNSGNAIIGNTFTAAQNGIYINGNAATFDQGWLIDGNTFGSTTIAADKLGFRGVSVQGVNDFTISNNTINGVVTTTTSTTTGISTFGISTNGNIFRNRISDIKNTNTTGYGSNGIALSGAPTASDISVYNNFISDVASYGFNGYAIADNGYGIVLASGGGYDIYYNTVLMNTDQTATTGNPAAINVTAGITTPGSVNLRNNIFATTQTVGTNRYAAMSTAASNVFADINYNDYYSAASSLGYFNGNMATLAAWRSATGKDQQSVSAAPVFAGAADLHLSNAAGANWCLNNTGVAIAGITTDIDVQARNNPPDIGADEFAAADNSVATPSNQTSCSGIPITAIVFSGAASSFSWTRDNTATVTGIAANGSGNISGTLTNTTTAPVTVTFTITPLNANGCAFSSTITATVVVNPSPNAAAAPASQAICSGFAMTPVINSGAVSGTVFNWTRDNTASVTGIPPSGTGNISGILTNTTSAPVTVTFIVTPTYTNAGATCTGATATAAVTVNTGNAISLTSAAGTDAQTVCINKPITNITYATVAATGATVSGLPAGVSGIWAANVFTISGTPTASGTFNYTITLTGGCGNVVTATGSVVVTPNNTITLTSAPGTNSQTRCINTAIVNITYGTTGATGATFSGLPAGVTGAWAANVATISGTPTVAGAFNYTVTMTGGCGAVTATGVINVTPNNTVSLSSGASTTSQILCVNTAIANITYATTGATGATFTGLPAGVSGAWAGNVATISGTPSATGIYNYTVTLTGGCGTITASGTINVISTNTVTLTSGAGTNAQTLCVNTPITSITYTTAGASGATFTGLPAGVTGTWAASVVTISGAPTASGVFSYTVTLTGGCGGIITATGSINVTPNNTATLTSAAGTAAQTRCINTAITTITYATTTATGATVTGLPSGVSGAWAGNVVTISGTPTVSGTFNYTVTLTGGCGTTTATGSITVTPNNTIALSSAAGTNAQTRCINTAIANITYATTTATGATFTGLPAGVTGAWAGNVATISGSPTASGTFNYTVTLTGGCGLSTATGSIAVTPNNTVSLSSTAGTNAQTRCLNTAIANITYATTGATGASFSGLPAGVSGSWAGNVATISGTPTASGTFNYTVTLTGGCGNITATGVITVNPLPTISVSPATATICTGNSITLTASGASTYAWSPGTGLSATSGSSVVASPASTFTYTITGTDANGCVNSTTKLVTVNSRPTVTISPAAPISFCEGLSATLTANGAVSYSWSPATGLSSSTGSPVLASPSVTTTYTVTGTGLNGCTNTATKTITILPAPDATITPAGYIDICQDDTVYFSAKAGYANYVWLLYGGPFQTGASNTASTFTGGYYTLRVTDASGCTSTTPAPSVVTVTQSPIPYIVAVGGNLEAPVGYSYYEWYLNGVLIPSANNRVLTPAANGVYTVWVLDATPLHCLGKSQPFLLTGVGVGGVNVADAIRLYPNPSNDVVHIEAPVPVNVTVSSMDGKQLFYGKDVKQINIGVFADGVYRVLITDKNGNYLRTDKITKVTK